MFGGRKGKDKARGERPKRASGGGLAQFGLMDVPGVDDLGNLDDMLDDDGGQADADLEAELAALMGGGGGGKSKPRVKKTAPSGPNLDAMVAECMKDYNDEDLSDTEDPNLLAELELMDNSDSEQTTAPRSHAPAPPQKPVQPIHDEPIYAGQSLLSIIQERKSVYKEAESIAKHNGDTSKARRCARGLKTLQDLEKSVLAGRPVNQDDIPPMISVGTRKETEVTPDITPESDSAPPPPLPSRSSPPSEPQQATPPPYQSPPYQPSSSQTPLSPPPPLPSESTDIKTVILTRRKELTQLALAAKQQNDKATAMEYMKRIKLCEHLANQDSVSLADIPSTQIIRHQTSQEENSLVRSGEPRQQPKPELNSQFSRDTPIVEPSNPNDIPAPQPEMFGAPPAPKSIMEALAQRLDKYKSEEAKAKESGNSSKARRMGRIVKQYDDAIKLHRAGRPFPRGDLPDPPGFGPIPLADQPGAAGPKPAAAAAAVAGLAPAASTPPKPAAVPAGASPAQPSPPAAPSRSPQPPKVGRQPSMMSVQDKQLAALEKRQKLFKEAALAAKQQGQTDTAKEYLRQALGLNKLIEVSKAGLPVDMTTLPTPPQLLQQAAKANDMDFEIVSMEESKITGDRAEMYAKLEQHLIAQVKMCMSNRTYFKEVGDIASSNKFEQMALHSKKDLDAVRFAFKRGDPVPKFHYETRAFSKVVSHTDLTDNDLELTIMSGINYVVKNPKEVDTYVKWEFPFPRETPTIDKTAVVKDSNNPEYNSKHMIVVNPRDKGFQRILKRGNVKAEVWIKGGFLRSDTLLGTATMKLATLETKCEIHDSFDLYSGRKPVGGKVEIKVRLRNPVVTKQIEQAQEKWLVVKFE